jgi:hypothetical protein
VDVEINAESIDEAALASLHKQGIVVVDAEEGEELGEAEKDTGADDLQEMGAEGEECGGGGEKENEKEKENENKNVEREKKTGKAKSQKKVKPKERKKKVIRLVQRPGDWYLSSPSCFWHRVRSVEAGDILAADERVDHTDVHDKNSTNSANENTNNLTPENVCTTLILRSGVFVRRVSGGRDHGNGKRSRGMIYATGECFKEMTPLVSKIMKEVEFRIPGGDA